MHKIFKWLASFFSKKSEVSNQTPKFQLKLTDEELKEISRKAILEVAAKKLATEGREECMRQFELDKKRKQGAVTPASSSRVSYQNQSSTRYDDDTTSHIITASIVASSFSSDDGGSYSSGSCDSGSSSGGCD